MALSLTCLQAWDAGRVKHPLPLCRTQGHSVLQQVNLRAFNTAVSKSKKQNTARFRGGGFNNHAQLRLVIRD